MDAARQLDCYTIDDVYNLPDGQRAELIDGELYMMVTPSRIHQEIVMDLSPAPFAVFLNINNDINKKLFKYRIAGVREYWIVDYKKNQIMVYNFEHDEMTDYTFSDRIKAGIYEDFEIDFSGIDME